MKKSKDVKFETHSSCAASRLAKTADPGPLPLKQAQSVDKMETTYDLFDFRTIVDNLNDVAIFNHSLNMAFE